MQYAYNIREDLNDLHATVDPNNLPSRKVLTYLGFEQTGEKTLIIGDESKNVSRSQRQGNNFLMPILPDFYTNEPIINEIETPPRIVKIREQDGIFFNSKFTSDNRIRFCLYEKICRAQKNLPSGITFMIYEAYRSIERQREMWSAIWSQMQQEFPAYNDVQIKDMCQKLVSDPDGIGSGHHFGCAVDITLCTKSGDELNMGTGIQDFSDMTETNSTLVSTDVLHNRQLLCQALEKEGVINYPREWWHFSYGDRLWAKLTGQKQTLYAPIVL